MRKILTAAGLAALLPASAPATALQAHRVTATGTPVALADAATLAYAPSPFDVGATLVLRGDDGTTRTVAAPAGCRLTGAGSGLLAGICGQEDSNSSAALDLVVTGLDGVPVARLGSTVSSDYANAAIDFTPDAVGRQWLTIPNGAKDSPNWTTAVNWHTGEVRDVYGVSPRNALDLGAPALSVPLCAPLRRYDAEGPFVDGVAPNVVVRGRWVLLQKPDETFVLRRCGSARPVALPKGFDPIALGDGWVAGVAAPATRNGARRLAVVRLSDRRRFVITGVRRDLPLDPRVMLTAGRAYVWGDGGISTVKLPAAP